MKTTSTTKVNQLDGRTAQQGRASGFASAPTCSLPQVVRVVSNSISVIDDHLEFLSFSLSGTLDGAGGVFAMHNAQCIMHNSPDSCEGQPRPHSLCIVHYELCIDGPARPDSFCILHSAFCIDAGLYYYGYRYYSPELGRWLTRDPIEEDGGDNLYAFCGNNGVATFDALGLQWTISRTGGNFALAQGSYDSIHSLADIIGLAVGDYKKRASPFSEPIPNSPYQILQCVKLRIPNTVIAYWAGDLGSFGKWWVNYNDGVEHLRELGFRVNSLSHGKDAVSIPIQSQLMSATRGKWLQGFYFWGHGYRPYPSQGLTNSRGESIIDYSSISLSYKLGITLLFACDSNSGMGSIASFSPGAIRVGHTGTLYPVNPWGYRVSDYIRHGDQGTK